MALIECDECGREISEDAETCPHCGCSMATSIGDIILKIVLFVVFFVLFLLAAKYVLLPIINLIFDL